jgi:hypothetical protein
MLGVPVWYKTMYLIYIFDVVESRYSEFMAKFRISSIIDSLIRILAIISSLGFQAEPSRHSTNYRADGSSRRGSCRPNPRAGGWGVEDAGRDMSICVPCCSRWCRLWRE